MGFFFLTFILLLGSILLLIVWFFTRSKVIGKLLLFGYLCLFGLILVGVVVSYFTEKKQLDRDDIYGTYVIDRSKFPGKQADWQYDHYRFIITKGNKFLFYATDKSKIIATYRGSISFKEVYEHPRLVIQLPEPHHHIMEKEPTLYRNGFSFYYVFNSPEFGNVFFTKGEWKPID
jgi:hypothetical protein